MSILSELRRRNVFKVGAAYAIVAWLLLQITDIVLPTFEAPLWVAQTVTFLLIIGFPITLLMAWAYEMTPEGIRAAADVQPSGSIAPATGQRLNYVILGLVVLAVGFLIADQYVLDQGMRASVVGTTISTIAVRETAGATPTPSSAQVRRFVTTLGPTEPLGDTLLGAHVAVSPDGGGLVYAAQMAGTSQLYFRAIDRFEASPLPGTEGAYHPFFSPDGAWVGFYIDGIELKKVSVRGGAAQTLADAVFSSGGSWVIEDTIVYGTQDESGGRSLFRIPASGGTPEVLLASNNEVGYVTPHVLPGGNAILFVSRPGGGGAGNAREGNIAVLSLETGETRTLIEGGFGPKYAPTGHLVFLRAEALWAVPFDAERLEKTGPEVPIIEGVQHDGFRGGVAYAFSNDGLLVYVPGVDTALGLGFLGSLVWVDRQGREEPLDAQPRSYNDLRLSPDGGRLAAASLTGGNEDIWIYDLARGTSSRLTFDPGIDNRPVWTPDGERVVFSSNRDGFGLYSKAADGTGQVERLTTGVNIQRAESFSPDGTRLVFREEVQASDLHVLSMEGELSSQPLLQTRFDEDATAISPDGGLMAYETNETGRYEIYVRLFPNVEDGKWQISTDGGTEPIWGPEGRELFYRSNDGMMAVSIETEPTFSAENPRLLFTENYVSLGARFPDYAVSPDGERFLMIKILAQAEQATTQTQLNIVNNWFEELNRLAPASQ